MLVYRVNKKERIECPTCWEECTVEVFQRVYANCKEGDDLIKIFSALTGLPYAQVSETKADELELELYRAVAFVLYDEERFRYIERPDTIKILGKTITIPKKIESLTVAQNFHVRSKMIGAKNIETLISFATAVYLQPLIDESKFDLSRAKEIEKEILKMNIFDIYPIGSFLLGKLKKSGSVGLPSLLWKKLKTAIRTPSSQRRPESKSSRSYTTSPLSICMLIVTVSLLALCKRSHSMSSSLSFCYGNVVTSSAKNLTE